MHNRYRPSVRLKIAIGLLVPLVVVLLATSYLRYVSYRGVLLEILDGT